MIYINTTYQDLDCTVFYVSTPSTAKDWVYLLRQEFDDHFYMTDGPLPYNLADYAPNRYAKYRRHILYNTDETGTSKPQLVVLEGGRQ